MIHLLKVMDFQPYLGVITRSLSLATPSLLHFFLLSFAVFFCFSMYGYLIFGGALEIFSTVLESMFSCFLLILNDNSSAYFLQRLESWDLIAAMLFFFMFIVFMVSLLLNFLIAIIVDAFMSIKDSNIIATSITSDLGHIIKPSYFGRGNNQPAFPPDSESRERQQHMLTVREKRIDAISLAMILQRRHDRERGELHMAELLSKCWSSASVNEGVDEEQLEQLSQAVVLQCGEVVKQSALPVKKPVQKLRLAHIKVGKETGDRIQVRGMQVRGGGGGGCADTVDFTVIGPQWMRIDKSLQAAIQASNPCHACTASLHRPPPIPHANPTFSPTCVCVREQKDLACSRAEVKELRSMMADMQALKLDLLARTPPMGNAAHAMGAPAGPSTAPSMRRAYTEPAPLCALHMESPQPLEQAVSRRDMPRGLSDSGESGGAVEGVERAGGVRGGLGIAGGSASRSLLASKQGSERQVSFKESTTANRKSPLRTWREWQQEPLV
ncbi:unnamed protein product [Closterium sp. NIES-54]